MMPRTQTCSTKSMEDSHIKSLFPAVTSHHFKNLLRSPLKVTVKTNLLKSNFGFSAGSSLRHLVTERMCSRIKKKKEMRLCLRVHATPPPAWSPVPLAPFVSESLCFVLQNNWNDCYITEPKQSKWTSTHINSENSHVQRAKGLTSTYTQARA